MKNKSLSLILAISLLISILCSVPNAYGSDANLQNVALGKTLTTDAEHGDSGSNVASMVDGQTAVNAAGDTKWYVKRNPDKAAFIIDLKDTYKIYSAKVYSGGTMVPAGIISDFSLEYWDGAAWNPIAGSEVKGNTNLSVSVEFTSPVETSRVKFLSHSAEEFRIREFELYADAAKPAAPNKVVNPISSSVPEDLINTRYESAVGRLASLNIIADADSYFVNDNITRAEFVMMLNRMLGFKDNQALYGADAYFHDVKETDPYNIAIKNAVVFGLTVGYGNGMFGPNDNLTNIQAVKMVVNLLGYRDYAEQTAFPLGYLNTANNLRLRPDVSAGIDAFISKGEVAIMLQRALDVNMMAQSIFGENISFTVSNGDTLLHKIFGGGRYGGLLSATETTAISGSKMSQKGTVLIDGKKFYVGDTNAKEYLGYYVNYQYTDIDDTGDYVLTYVEVDKNRNDAIVVNAEDIRYDTSTLISLKYDSADKIREARISQVPYVIYNGKASRTFDLQDFDLETGNIRLIDWDCDNTYDVVIITSYQTYVVDSVNVTNFKIFDKYNQPAVALDYNQISPEWVMTKDGAPIEIGALNMWDILSVAASKDGEFVEIKVSQKSIKGNVSMLSDGDIFTSVTLDGRNDFEIAKSCPGQIRLEDSGTFYLDIFGRIAAFSVVSNAVEYGILYKVHQKTGIEGDVLLRVLGQNGMWMNIAVKDKFEFNGGSAKSSILLTSPLIFTGGAVKAQLIKYKTNSSGEIIKLMTETDRTATPDAPYDVELLSKD